MTREGNEFRERYTDYQEESPRERSLGNNMLAEKIIAEHGKEKPDWDDTRAANDYLIQHLLAEFNRREPNILKELEAGLHSQPGHHTKLLEVRLDTGKPVEYRDLDDTFREAMTAYRDATHAVQDTPREYLANQFAQLLVYPVAQAAGKTMDQELMDRTTGAQTELAWALSRENTTGIVLAIQDLHQIQREIRAAN